MAWMNQENFPVQFSTFPTYFCQIKISKIVINYNSATMWGPRNIGWFVTPMTMVRDTYNIL